MPKFTIHSIDSAPSESRPTLEAVTARFGFVPHLIGELAAAPSVVKAYATLSELLAQTSLSPVEQQILLAAVSVANECTYCVAAHSAALKHVGLPDDQIRAIREATPLADAMLEALRKFSTTVVEGRGHVREFDVQAFLEAGYQRAQIFEVLLGVTLKTLSNYTNHIAHERREIEVWRRVMARRSHAGDRLASLQRNARRGIAILVLLLEVPREDPPVPIQDEGPRVRNTVVAVAWLILTVENARFRSSP
jgi:uncharacterized peroxidase-related enzyme